MSFFYLVEGEIENSGDRRAVLVCAATPPLG
jgi:hypothetical protein